jgi:hypothetical protein
MSCSNSKSPANISKSKILNDCYLKCNYNFNYGTSSCTATNKSSYLNLSYEYRPNTKQAVFNNNEMIIKNVKIFKPSLHTFDGSHSDAELVITHRGTPRPFLVCIPIISGSVTSDASTILEYIINESSKKIPNVNESTTININTYNLDKIIPVKPFYSYLGNIPYNTLCEECDYVVFDTTNAIQINSNVMSKLGNMITSSNIPTVASTNLFYNIKGPNSGNNTEDIYIDCKPVDSSGNILVSQYESPSGDSGSSESTFNFEDITNSIFFKIFIGLVIAMVIYKAGKYLFNIISSPSTSSPAPSTSTVNNTQKAGGKILKSLSKVKKIK